MGEEVCENTCEETELDLLNCRADYLRKNLKEIGAMVEEYKKDLGKQTDKNVSEIMANVTLAYRHIEDASMRLGKVKQHLNDGVSVYDKNVVGSPE